MNTAKKMLRINAREPAPLFPPRIALGLGGNLGRVDRRMAGALAALRQAGLTDLRVSSLYRSTPVGCVPGVPPFLNAAATGRWGGSPASLLRVCQETERQLGRPARHSSSESRPIDLDILLFDTLCIRTPSLTLPHPRMHERLFVLLPLAEIAPSWPVPPNGITVETLCRRCRTHKDDQRVERLETPALRHGE